MPTEETSFTTAIGSGNMTATWDAAPQQEPEMTRERYLELTKVAMEVVALLDKKKVTHREGCTVRQIAENLWGLPCKPKRRR